jgi:hypothetical protein
MGVTYQKYRNSCCMARWAASSWNELTDNQVHWHLTLTWKLVVEWFRTFGPGWRIPGSSPGRTRSLYLRVCSPTAAQYQRPSGVCLPVIHAPKILLNGSFKKRRGISPVSGFQFSAKSESLDLNGAQPLSERTQQKMNNWHLTKSNVH